MSQSWTTEANLEAGRRLHLAGSSTRSESISDLMLGGFLAVCLLTTGCAGMNPTSWGSDDGVRARRVPPLRVVRNESPADYDVLVGEFAAIEGKLDLAHEAFSRAAKKDPDSAFVHDRLAHLSWQLEDMETAVLESERAFELAPDDVDIRLFLGRLYRLGGNFEGLNRVLRDEAGRPLDADSAYALFRVALDQRDLMAAENLARQLAEMEPEQLRGRLGLATVAEQRKDYDAAESIVRRGLDDFPDHFLLFMRLVQIERQRGDKAGEIAVYEEVLASHPNHYGILQQLGQAQLETNDIDGAIDTFTLLVETYPEDLNSLRRLASMEFSAGRYESAASRLEAVLDGDPDQPELIFALGQIRRALGNDEGAYDAFERIGPSATNYVDARLQIVALLETQERYAEALVEVDRLRVLRPNRQVDFHAAGLRIEMGDVDGGLELLTGLLNGTDDDLEVLYQLGVQHGVNGDADEALRYMQRVLEIEPNNANALNFIGYSWAEQGVNLAEAEELIRRAIELSPGDGFITDSLGWVYYKMAEGLFAEARTEEALSVLQQAQDQLMQASEMTGGDAVVSEHLGDVLLLRGDKRGALNYYEEAVELELREDEQPNLLEKLERLQRELGVQDEAL